MIPKHLRDSLDARLPTTEPQTDVVSEAREYVATHFFPDNRARELITRLCDELVEARGSIAQKLTEQRRELGALHDETLRELERVRDGAKTEIERLQEIESQWNEAVESGLIVTE